MVFRFFTNSFLRCQRVICIAFCAACSFIMSWDAHVGQFIFVAVAYIVLSTTDFAAARGVSVCAVYSFFDIRSASAEHMWRFHLFVLHWMFWQFSLLLLRDLRVWSFY